MHIFCPSVTDLAEIAEPRTSGNMLTPAHVQGGPPIDPLTGRWFTTQTNGRRLFWSGPPR
jgi:hypothetical protein